MSLNFFKLLVQLRYTRNQIVHFAPQPFRPTLPYFSSGINQSKVENSSFFPRIIFHDWSQHRYSSQKQETVTESFISIIKTLHMEIQVNK
jgi:hypothetical protein